MNYFGHAAIAVRKGSSSGYILGAMLPDLCAMARIKPLPFADPQLSAGVQFHVSTDAVFHQSRTFLDLNAMALAELGKLGVRRGPARASAHIGVEMLIDAELCSEKPFLDGYLRALRWGMQESRIFKPLGFASRTILRRLCRHLQERGAQVHKATPERFYERLGHTLNGRRRLEPTNEELTRIANYLSGEVRVGAQVPQLLRELEPLSFHST